MFLATLAITRAASVIEQINKEINTYRHVATEDTDITLISPRNDEFLIVLTEKSSGVNITYSYPVGTIPQPYDVQKAAYIFPYGDAEFNIKLQKGQSVGFSYATIVRQACTTGLHIISKKEINYRFDAGKNNTDFCLFFTSGTESRSYDIECHLGSDKITVFHEQMNNSPYGTYVGEDNPGMSMPSSRPLLFRLNTNVNNDSGYAILTGVTKDVFLDSIDFEGNATQIQAQPEGVFQYYIGLPIVGIIPTIVLIAAWVYAFIRIQRKKPSEFA